MPYIKTNGELYHHGIRGQKWGQRNGPPYPLKEGAHSSSERKAGWKKSVSGGLSTEAKRRIVTSAAIGAGVGTAAYAVSRVVKKKREANSQPQASYHVRDPYEEYYKQLENEEKRERNKKIVKGALIGIGATAVTAAAGIAIYKLNKSGALDEGRARVQNFFKNGFGDKKVDEVISLKDIEVIPTPPKEGGVFSKMFNKVSDFGYAREGISNVTSKVHKPDAGVNDALKKAARETDFVNTVKKSTSDAGITWKKAFSPKTPSYTRTRNNSNMSIDELNDLLLKRNARSLRR